MYFDFLYGKYKKIKFQSLIEIILNTKARNNYFLLYAEMFPFNALMNRITRNETGNLPYNIWRCCSNATARENDSGVLPLQGNPWNV